MNRPLHLLLFPRRTALLIHRAAMHSALGLPTDQVMWDGIGMGWDWDGIGIGVGLGWGWGWDGDGLELGWRYDWVGIG